MKRMNLTNTSLNLFLGSISCCNLSLHLRNLLFKLGDVQKNAGNNGIDCCGNPNHFSGEQIQNILGLNSKIRIVRYSSKQCRSRDYPKFCVNLLRGVE